MDNGIIYDNEYDEEMIEYMEMPVKDKKRFKRRKQNFKKAIRKQKIAKTIYHYDYYKNLNQYSKNKIHCSCEICACKTNDKFRKGSAHGARGQKEYNYWEEEPFNITLIFSDGKKETVQMGGIKNNPLNKRAIFSTTNHRNGKNWKTSDLKKIQSMEFQIKEII